MPEYDFKGLSSQDFELLTRDVLNAEYELRLVSHPAGRDQGIDLRAELDDGAVVVVQCKHYAGSKWSDLGRAVTKEAGREVRPRCDRYVFVTSQGLTAQNRAWIVDQFSAAGFPIASRDVWGADDLNEALGRFPDVERRHFKLWLRSVNALQTTLHAGRWQRRQALLERADEHAPAWVAVPEFDLAWRRLEESGLCVLTGPPGAGKTCLAEMLTLVHWDAGWDIQVANDLESAWAALTPGPKRFIFYDDFLGATELALTAETGDLLRLIERSRSRPDVRLVLTTRSQILNRARELEDRVAELTRRREVVVQVGDHSYEIRAHILRNHLYFSRLTPVERDRIRLDNRLTTAVRHPSYNPRLIASVTDEITETSTADEVTERLLAVLNKPEELWRATFLRMDRLRRDILLTLATLPPVPHPVSDLLALVTVEDAVQWAPAMSELEPTWIRHVDRPPRNVVVLANPGCRDFLLNVLDDAAVANEQLAKARRLDQYVALTRAAGLQHGTVTRPALAEVLKRRAREILEAVRALTLDTLAVESPAKDQLATIADAVLLASVYGTEDGTSWVLDLVAEQLPAWGRLDASTRDFLRVAERLVELPAVDRVRTDILVGRVVMAGFKRVKRIRDLDAAEAFPEALLPDAALALLHERTRDVLEAVLDYLTYHVDDPETLATEARSLRDRARSHGIDVDIADLLDKADDLAHKEYEDGDSV